MTNNPDQIRREIEDTRGRLSSDVNALTETVSGKRTGTIVVGSEAVLSVGMGVSDPAVVRAVQQLIDLEGVLAVRGAVVAIEQRHARHDAASAQPRGDARRGRGGQAQDRPDADLLRHGRGRRRAAGARA